MEMCVSFGGLMRRLIVTFNAHPSRGWAARWG